MKQIILMSTILISCFAFANTDLNKLETSLNVKELIEMPSDIDEENHRTTCITNDFYKDVQSFNPMTGTNETRPHKYMSCVACYAFGVNGPVLTSNNCTFTPHLTIQESFQIVKYNLNI